MLTRKQRTYLLSNDEMPYATARQLERKGLIQITGIRRNANHARVCDWQLTESGEKAAFHLEHPEITK